MRTDGIRTLDDLLQRCHVDDVTGCWLWQGKLSPSGVPCCRPSIHFKILPAQDSSARRVAWVMSGRRVDAGQAVYRAPKCHEHRCINPEHAAVGPAGAQGAAYAKRHPARMRSANRMAGLRRDDIKRALPPERVAEIERELATGITLLECARRCGVHWQTARAIRNRAHVHQRGGQHKASSVFAWASMG